MPLDFSIDRPRFLNTASKMVGAARLEMISWDS